MALVIVVLRGGPDDGVELGYHVPPPLPAHIDYSGSIYDKTNDKTQPIRYAYNLDKSQGGLKATKLMNGWHSLERTMNKRMPAAVNKARHETNAALRSLGRGHKVHR